jgi:hypothetical protein
MKAKSQQVISKPNISLSNQATSAKVAKSKLIQKLTKKINSLESIVARNKQYALSEHLGDLKEHYAEYQDNVLADYIYGIFHPDVAYRDKLDIKSPSYLPIPTTTFRFKETFTIKSNVAGNFVLHWNPNFLGSTSELKKNYGMPNGHDIYYSNISVNVDSGLTGYTDMVTGWEAVPFREVAQTFQKYRLTSACIKVIYTGKVIDESGMFAAAATYKNVSRTICQNASEDLPIANYSLPDRIAQQLASFGDFDNIRQGQWSLTQSIIENPAGITCIYVPTDPLNQVFVNDSSLINFEYNSFSDADHYIKALTPTNANISYTVCGYGLPETTCVTVESYYNYEIIVAQEQNPYFNPTLAKPALLKNGTFLSTIGSLVSSMGLIKDSRKFDDKSILGKVRAILSRGVSKFKDMYQLLGPLYSVLV